MKQIDLETKPTYPVMNWLYADNNYAKKYIDLLLSAMLRGSADLVTQHKRLFGPQDVCWNGEFRHWIWELPNGLRIWVSNHKGVGLEMPVNSSINDVYAAIEQYYKTLSTDDI